MNARMKFLAGAGVIVGSVGFLMASAINDTGAYFLLPAELEERSQTDANIHQMGIRVGGNVVEGSIQREPAEKLITFQVTDGEATFPVIFRGIAPDTFTDAVEVVVEGRLNEDGTLEATNVLAKCGSRYEAVPTA